MASNTRTEGFDLEGKSRADARLGVVRVRGMEDTDLERILELRSVVRWSADPRAFDLLRGIRGARWAVAAAPDGELAGMVGAVPLGKIGILCQLAVRDGYREAGLGRRLSAWAIRYLKSRGATTVRLYSTRQAEGLYRSLGFEAVTPRTVYRLEKAPGPALGRRDGRVGKHHVSTLAFGDLPELYGVDLWSHGADRSALILSTLRLHPGWGLVVRDASGRIKGYLVRSSLGPTIRVGPFVAESIEVARLLLDRALAESEEDAPVEATVPGNAASPAHALLEEFDFGGRTDRLRMELGQAAPLRRSGLHHYGTTPYLAT